VRLEIITPELEGIVMGLIENLSADCVKHLNLREAVCVSSDVPVRYCVEKMRSAALGCVVIVDDDHKPLGMFTEAVLRELLLKEPDVLDQSVSQVMASPAPWVHEDDPVSTVLEAMERKNIRFVCVVDAQGVVKALTGQKGLMEFIAEHYPHQAYVQREDSTAFPSTREGA
jgi:CBS domain-containing protein